MLSLGVCVGSSTIQYVLLKNHKKTKSIIDKNVIYHKGNPHKTLEKLLKDKRNTDIDRFIVTGRSFRTALNAFTISEPEAVEYALNECNDVTKPNLVVSLGGENTFVYKINNQVKIVSVHTGNKCASGTGDFFIQQLRRMGIKIEEVSNLASQGNPYKVAGRCSVFCKSDCTHALNKGEPIENIVAGLCCMIADKVDELIKDIPFEYILITGGGTENKKLMKIFKERYKDVSVSKISPIFEAYGAAVCGFEKSSAVFPDSINNVFLKDKLNSFFNRLPPLESADTFVQNTESYRDVLNENDDCILGLDVGSTTTKAVLVRRSDKKILSSIYLRTNGNPIKASRECYSAIAKQTENVNFTISGLGVTGSGRQIAGLHALTKNVINEIIAHATAAAHYNPNVDTIFEIGGQDAKYTSLTNGIPADYAMNEACSAGTGSFLEESAGELLSVKMEDIASNAIKGNNPLNFSDQCSAFISSDINRAIQENVGNNDILAGLVYSICMNYLNRVKSSRSIGNTIFMQGGVCYNKAIPLAMASLLKANIIVPADPGLMGAYGVALEVINRSKLSTSNKLFDLNELANRAVENESPFICAGGHEKCDRKCEISRIKINNKVYPFGGICDLYYNLRIGKKNVSGELDLVIEREKLLFQKYGPSLDSQAKNTKVIGIPRSFLTHSFYPLFSNFFSELGLKVILSDKNATEGRSRKEAAFCFPAEVSHGNFYNLLKKNPDYIFLPHIITVPTSDGDVKKTGKNCVFIQAEAYYLKSTYRNELENSTTVLLTPVLNMQNAYEDAANDIVKMAGSIGLHGNTVKTAWKKACLMQKSFENNLKELGKKALEKLDQDKSKFAIVLFGRPYNAFDSDTNMGIPHKVTTRGHLIIPHEMLPYEISNIEYNMYWASGQEILLAADFVKSRDNLFGFYITNFSCGPDSFLIDYFREKMNNKPSLTIELDQHTADAGIDTRIEAAVDVMSTYFETSNHVEKPEEEYKTAEVYLGKDSYVISSYGEKINFKDPRVELLVTPMGRRLGDVITAALKATGIHAVNLPVSNNDCLLYGRKNTSCKECLPYILTSGNFINYIENIKNPDKVTLFLMGAADGPCRFGQYQVAFTNYLKKNKIRNVSLLVVNDTGFSTLYKVFGRGFLYDIGRGVNLADIFGDIESMLSVTANNPVEAHRTLDNCWDKIISYIEGKNTRSFKKFLCGISETLKKIPLKKEPIDVPVITLTGEIYVRNDEFSKMNLMEYLEDHGFAVHIAPLIEYADYSLFCIKNGFDNFNLNLLQTMFLNIAIYMNKKIAKDMKNSMAKSGLYFYDDVNVDEAIDNVDHLIDKNFLGESILTVSLALHEILDKSCGVISIGPFGCMPSRVAESILKKEMNIAGKQRLNNWNKKALIYKELETLPFLAIETDGNPFPQLIEANLEAFVLQAKRVHEKMLMESRAALIT
ncbi:MAG TPA: acyl-CoA dehydratase activase [Victivallales bacterium]|nr:acyl-CoA dehydratase activase [Victivallales bacterium]